MKPLNWARVKLLGSCVPVKGLDEWNFYRQKRNLLRSYAEELSKWLSQLWTYCLSITLNSYAEVSNKRWPNKMHRFCRASLQATDARSSLHLRSTGEARNSSKRGNRSRGPSLESPDNFSDPKSHLRNCLPLVFISCYFTMSR